MHKGKLVLHSVKERVRLGCTAEERAYPQTVTFDLELHLHPNRSTTSDDLNDTADYMAAARCLHAMCSGGEWKLLEKMCFDIGGAIRELSPAIAGVSIRARKNILPNGEGISFEMLVE